MNLSDMLVYADIQQLNRIASVYDCKCNSNSKHELIQSILLAMGSKVFEDDILKMSLEELRFINTLLFETKKSYSMEDLIARALQSNFEETLPNNKPQDQMINKIALTETDTSTKKKLKNKKASQMNEKQEDKTAYKSPREMIAAFKHRGWLFNGYNGPSKYLFHVPQDIKHRFQKVMLQQFSKKLEPCPEPEAYRDEQLLIEEDITLFLRFVEQNEVQLSADGSMYKRWLTAILECLHIEEALPSKGEWRFGYGRHFNVYPNRFSLLYNHCKASGYIAEQLDDKLVLTQAGTDRLSAKRDNEISAVYLYWLKQYKTPIPNITAIVNWLAELCSSRWVSVASLEEVLLPYIKPYFYDSAKSILEQRILIMLLHLGMIRIGEHSEAGKMIRITPLGRAVIQGTYKG